MPDLHECFRELDRLEAPDMCADIEQRANAAAPMSLGPRLVTVSWWRGPLVAIGTALAIVMAVTAAVLVWRSEPADVDDTTPPASPTTTAPSDETAPPVLGDGEWRQATASEPWVRWLVDVEGLSGGGFVAVASEPSPWSVIWSPDGLEWLDGDPRGLVPTQTKRVAALGDEHTISDHTVVVVADRVVVLDQANTAVLIGHPQTGEWIPIGLQTAGLEGTPVPLAVASNDREVLVIHAVAGEAATELAFWVVDPAAGTSAGPMLPGIGIELGIGMPLDVGWVDDHWILMANAEPFEETRTRNFLWISPDATAWTEVALPNDGTGDDGPGGLAEFGGHLVASPSGAVVQRGYMGGSDTWYSPDGIEWQRVLDGSSGAAYSESLGFIVGDVTDPGGLRLLASTDGTSWDEFSRVPSDMELAELFAASDGSVLIGRDDGAGNVGQLWLWSSNPLPPVPAPTPTTAPAPAPPPWTWPSGEPLKHPFLGGFEGTEQFAARWEKAWFAGDAAGIAEMFTDDGVYAHVDDLVEHRGRAEIESALRAHFASAAYFTFSSHGAGLGEPVVTPTGTELAVEVGWTWSGTWEGEDLYNVEAGTQFVIDYDSGQIIRCLHSDWGEPS